MISISAITSPAQAATYFGRRDDYYVRGQESPSEWHGQGAAPLCLSGEVDKEAFKDLLEGHLPTGDTLGRFNAVGEREHKPGYDLTFRPPKSYSVAALVGGDERLVEAHDQAVKTTLQWLESEHLVTRVKMGGQTSLQHTGNLTAALFLHETSRSRDPLLHTHAVIANVTQRADGQWRSIEGREIYKVQHLTDKIFQSELSLRARDLGYEVKVDREAGRFELARVPVDVRDAFSQRSQEIEANLAQNGKTRKTASAAEREVSCLSTRSRKLEVDRSLLRDQWLTRSRDLGYDPERTVAEARARALEIARQPIPDRQLEAERGVREAVQHLAERSAAFRVTDLTATLSNRCFGELSRHELDRAVDRIRERGELIEKPVRTLWNSGKSEPGYTTKEGQKIERQLLDSADRGKGVFRKGITTHDQALSAIDRAEIESQKVGYTWNDQQRQAAEGILTSRDRFVAVQGAAGTAKTSTVLRSVAQTAKAQGFEVKGLTPSAAAAQALESGAAVESRTLHSWLGQLHQAQILAKQGYGADRQSQDQPTRKSLWIVDEAGMVGARQMRDLLKAAEAHNARVVLVGDTKQLGSIEAGRAFSQIQSEVATFRLERILRQRDSHLRFAVEQIYKGKMAQAFDKICEQGGLIEIGNPGGDRENGLAIRSQAIADSYLVLSPQERERTIVIAPGHDDRAAINSAIRAGLVTEGAVQRYGLKAVVLERKGLTKSEIRNADSYKPGEVVRFARGYQKHGIEKGSYWQVENVNTNDRIITLSRGDQQLEWRPVRLSRVEVFRSQSLEVAPGDKIIFNRNDRNAGLVNGQTATVRHMNRETGQAVVVGRDGQAREINLGTQQHWTYAYAVTAHAAQGSTADRAFVHAESHRANLVNQRSLYVGVSRVRDELRIFTDSKDSLREAVQLRTGEKEVALESRLAPTERAQDYGLSR